VPESLFSLLVVAAFAIIGLVFFWPKSGLFWRWQRARQMTERVLIEDTLKHIQESGMNGRRPTLQSIAGSLGISTNLAADLLSSMEAHKLLEAQAGEFELTPSGRAYALQIMRAHRLWERYLADETGFVENEWHDQAHRYEHMLSPAEMDALAKRLGHPTHDPHGDPIPTAQGEVVPHRGRPLTMLDIDQPARIIHLEDEPSAVYAQLVAEGLWPGMELHLTEISPHRVRFWADGDEHVLAPVVADNISVLALPQSPEESEPVPDQRLTDLKPGEKAKVASISRSVRGMERRRLLDLGILPGTAVEAEMASPSGDPTAYRIRGAVIALRREQADHIHVKRQKEAVQ
jgi:DtxR family Mn-dependent transcriptional regulator